MAENLIAESSITIAAPEATVWAALIGPEAIKEYMFSTTVVTDWKVGSPIVWKGEWEGKPYEDKGKLLQLEPRHLLQYSHFSPLSGAPDKPESYHTVTITLSEKGKRTQVSLTQDKNATEKERVQASEQWATMLTGLKKYVESSERG